MKIKDCPVVELMSEYRMRKFPNIAIECNQCPNRQPDPLVAELVRVANNAIYFDDSSDFKSALWEICQLGGIDMDAIGAEFIEKALLAKAKEQNHGT